MQAELFASAPRQCNGPRCSNELATQGRRKDVEFCSPACKTRAWRAREQDKLRSSPTWLQAQAELREREARRVEAEIEALRSEARILRSAAAGLRNATQLDLTETRSARLSRIYGITSTDCWRTPLAIFRMVQSWYSSSPFVLDAAAVADDTLCSAHIGPIPGGLDADWHELAHAEVRRLGLELGMCAPGVWNNPPYSRRGGGIAAWVRKAREARDMGLLVVQLLPADTSTEWYREAQRWAHSIVLLPRIAHIHPDTGQPMKGARFGSALVIWNELGSRQTGAFVSTRTVIPELP